MSRQYRITNLVPGRVPIFVTHTKDYPIVHSN